MVSPVLFRITLPAVLLVSAVPVAAQTEDRPPVSLPSGSMMQHDRAGTESWTYSQPLARFSRYRTVIVDPTVVYQGPDAQFSGIAAADRARFADIITQELRSELAQTFPAPARPQADTLRVRVTLLGADKTTGGVATATRVTPFGFATSALKSALGKGGSLTGSLLYAVELYDGKTNELLLAAVRRRTPDPLDVPATLSTTETVKSVARDFANSARRRLEEMTGVKR